MKRVLALALTIVALSACSGGEAVAEHPADRLLIVSMPGVSWSEVRSGALPTLRAFADEAAIGNLATRIGRREATAASAYLTIGAGTRAVAPREATGVGLEPDELYHDEPAVDVVQRRLGLVPDGVAYLAIGAARDANDRSVYGAEVGALGDELKAAGIDRAVIANADQREGRSDDAAYGRSAVAMLMSRDGLLPAGAVSRRLLTDDADAPFGVRLDPDAVDAAFASAWQSERTVVLVEASDLLRTNEYARTATSERRRAQRQQALHDADDLLGTLLDHVGPRDAVLVLSPVAPAGAPDLGIVALRQPGAGTGLLRSATTRRDGYVQLADVGPTIMTVLGEDEPDHGEGRAFQIAEPRADGLVSRLARAGEQAEFRDDIVPATVTTLIVLLAALTLVGIFRDRLPARLVRALPIAAAGMLGALPATFFSAIIGIDGMAAYVALLVAGGVIVALAARLAERRWPGTAAIVSVGSVVLLIAADVLVGAPLQLNTVFGYSVAVAGRFAGVGNLAFALLGSGALVLAALVAERYGARGRRIALGVLAVVLLVDGLPVLGADVGGVLSIVPAFGLAALVLLGRRIGVREIVATLAAAFGVLFVVAFIDLARPDADQTHLARLAQHLLDRRWDPFFSSLTRRWSASFGSGETGAWVVLLLVSGVLGLYLALRIAGRSTRVRTRPSLDPPERAAAVGLAVLAGLGLVANDSSFAVPFTMLHVVAPAVLQRLDARPPEPEPVP
jgi:hypothetical protein